VIIDHATLTHLLKQPSDKLIDDRKFTGLNV